MTWHSLYTFIRTKKLTKCFVLSYIFFWLFMFLDIYTTLLVSQGDLSLEGNQWAVLWYTIAGSWAPIEVILWPAGVLLAAYIFNLKSSFVAIWYLNWVAFSHLLGWLTWTNLAIYVFKLQSLLLNTLHFDFDYARPLSVIGLFFGLILALIQVQLCAHGKKRTDDIW